MFEQLADKFSKPTAKQDEVEAIGEQLLLIALKSSSENLNEHRYSTYMKKTATSTKAVPGRSLGPTTDAAGLHCLRAYHQLMQWKGVHLDPVLWGFKMRGNYLLPIRIRIGIAPRATP